MTKKKKKFNQNNFATIVDFKIITTLCLCLEIWSLTQKGAFFPYMLSCCSELDLHSIRFWSQSHPINWFIVRFSSILWPRELELPEQRHHDEEQLHTSQTLAKTHTRA